jgi:hypothetical protein
MRKLILNLHKLCIVTSLLYINGFQGIEVAAPAPLQERHAHGPVMEVQPLATDSSWIIRWKDREHPDFRKSSQVVSEHGRMNIVVARPVVGIDPQAWVEAWSQSPSVEYMQENHSVRIAAKVNDPFAEEQHYLRQIGAEKAWDVISENKSLAIALIDTGVDLEHPDLKGNLLPGINLIDPGAPPQDDNGHGTNVAGVIAAVSNNKQGISGLVWKAQIMPIKALEANGRGDEDKLGEGIRYAVDQGVKIVVLSVGLYPSSPYMRDVVQYAEDNGVLLISASGNDGKSVKYPAAYPTVLAVGGVTADNRVEPNSNYGPEIDVVAPWDVFTTQLGGGYTYNEGTSMAAPQVAGVAALLWAQYPEFKPHQIRHMIRQTAEDIEAPGWDPYSGYGLVRADRALTEKYSDDFNENNNQRELAKPLPRHAMISAAISGAADEDWFFFQAPYDGKMRLRLMGDEEVKDIRMIHFASDNPTTGTAYPNAAALKSGIIIDVKKGKGWILLKTDNKNLEKTVKYRLISQFEIYRDAFEDNDRQYKAYTLAAKTQKLKGTFHQVGDEDWFALHIDQSGSLRIKLWPDTIRMDLSLLVQKKGEKPITIDIGGDGDAEYSPNLDVLPGKYYIRVKNVIYDNPEPVTGEYTLEIDYTSKMVDPNEPNDKPFQAVSMSNSTVYTGVLDKSSDVDWFSFKVEQTGLVTLDLRGIPIDRLMSLTLYDQNQRKIAFDINALEMDRMSMENVLQSGTYLVRLSADYPFHNQMYKLSISQQRLVAGFKDISGHWAEEAIAAMSGKKIVSGYGSYTFAPNHSITRGEAAVMIAKAFKLTKTKTLQYADVSKHHWAYEYIGKVSQAGIMEGYPDGRFRPERIATRAEMAAMVANAMQLKAKNKGPLPFTDIKKGYWAAPMLRKLKEEGWIAGYGDGTFRPEERASRAEFVSLLYSVLQRPTE